jgi:hypothetical protein
MLSAGFTCFLVLLHLTLFTVSLSWIRRLRSSCVLAALRSFDLVYEELVVIL